MSGSGAFPAHARARRSSPARQPEGRTNGSRRRAPASRILLRRGVQDRHGAMAGGSVGEGGGSRLLIPYQSPFPGSGSDRVGTSVAKPPIPLPRDPPKLRRETRPNPPL